MGDRLGTLGAVGNPNFFDKESFLFQCPGLVRSPVLSQNPWGNVSDTSALVMSRKNLANKKARAH